MKFVITVDCADNLRSAADVANLFYGIDDGQVDCDYRITRAATLPAKVIPIDYAANLLRARATWERAKDGYSLELVRKAQVEYDAHVPACALPNRPMTTAERRLLERDILSVIDATIHSHTCSLGKNGTKAECDTCMRLHNSIFTDPPCVDHG